MTSNLTNKQNEICSLVEAIANVVNLDVTLWNEAMLQEEDWEGDGPEMKFGTVMYDVTIKILQHGGFVFSATGLDDDFIYEELPNEQKLLSFVKRKLGKLQKSKPAWLKKDEARELECLRHGYIW